MPDMGAFLWPNAVAVVGASSDEKILRGRIMHVMLQHDFKGNIYPISRSSDEIMGLKTYASVEDLPERVDLAIMIIPAKFVPDELERCGKAGVKAVQILTSGFAEESGDSGNEAQQRLVDIAQKYDMAVVGPNSEGFANTGANLCPTFSPVFDNQTRPIVPEWRDKGRIAAIAQSGGIGFAFYDHSRPREIPSSYVVTTGNEANVQLMDVVDHILDRGDTDAFLMFMEDVKDPETFKRVAAKAARAGKPIIVTKVGKSAAGERAAASHTAALAGSYSGYQAMFRKYGIIEGYDIDEMIDIAAGFSYFSDKLPRGKHVGIITGSGGGGGMMADACSLAGLEVPTLDDATRAMIDKDLPSYATSQNPVDGTAGAIRTIGYANLARMVGESPVVDTVIGITSGRRASTYVEERESFEQLQRDLDKPFLVWSYTVPHPDSITALSKVGFPMYTDIRNVARTVKEMADYRAFHETFVKAPEISTGNPTAKSAAAEILAAAGTALCEYEARPALAAYGICDNEGAVAANEDDAVRAFAALDKTVVMKVQSPDILHKSDAGGVVLNLQTKDDVTAAYRDIIANAEDYNANADIRGVLVQPMAAKGVEVILGVNRDEKFGPMLMVGLGGIFVEVLKDVAFAPVPFGKPDAEALLKQLKGYAVLEGARGEPAADIDALTDVMVKLSQFAADFTDDVAEIDLNPVLVHPAGQGLSVADALIVKSN